MARKLNFMSRLVACGAITGVALFAGTLSPTRAEAAKRQTLEQVNARLDTACIAFEAVEVPSLTDDPSSLAPAFRAYAKALATYESKTIVIAPAETAVTNVVKGLRKLVTAMKSDSNLIVSLARGTRTIAKAQDLSDGFGEKFATRAQTIADAMLAVDLIPCASLLLPDSETTDGRVDLPAENFPPLAGYTYVEGEAERKVADALFDLTGNFYSALTVKAITDQSGVRAAFVAGYIVADPTKTSQVIDAGAKVITGVEEPSLNGFRAFYGAQGTFDKALFIRGQLVFEFTTDKTPSASLIHQIATAFITAQSPAA